MATTMQVVDVKLFFVMKISGFTFTFGFVLFVVRYITMSGVIEISAPDSIRNNLSIMGSIISILPVMADDKR